MSLNSSRGIGKLGLSANAPEIPLSYPRSYQACTQTAAGMIREDACWCMFIWLFGVLFLGALFFHGWFRGPACPVEAQRRGMHINTDFRLIIPLGAMHRLKSFSCRRARAPLKYFSGCELFIHACNRDEAMGHQTLSALSLRCLHCLFMCLPPSDSAFNFSCERGVNCGEQTQHFTQ